MSPLLALLVLPLALFSALLVMAQNRWGKAGRAACLFFFVITLYSAVAVFSYNGARAAGESCDLPATDPYFDQWTAQDALLWPLMFLTGHGLPAQPC